MDVENGGVGIGGWGLGMIIETKQSDVWLLRLVVAAWLSGLVCHLFS